MPIFAPNNSQFTQAKHIHQIFEHLQKNVSPLNSSNPKQYGLKPMTVGSTYTVMSTISVTLFISTRPTHHCVSALTDPCMSSGAIRTYAYTATLPKAQLNAAVIG